MSRRRKAIIALAVVAAITFGAALSTRRKANAKAPIAVEFLGYQSNGAIAVLRITNTSRSLALVSYRALIPPLDRGFRANGIIKPGDILDISLRATGPPITIGTHVLADQRASGVEVLHWRPRGAFHWRMRRLFKRIGFRMSPEVPEVSLTVHLPLPKTP